MPIMASPNGTLARCLLSWRKRAFPPWLLTLSPCTARRCGMLPGSCLSPAPQGEIPGHGHPPARLRRGSTREPACPSYPTTGHATWRRAGKARRSPPTSMPSFSAPGQRAALSRTSAESGMQRWCPRRQARGVHVVAFDTGSRQHADRRRGVRWARAAQSGYDASGAQAARGSVCEPLCVPVS